MDIPCSNCNNTININLSRMYHECHICGRKFKMIETTEGKVLKHDKEDEDTWEVDKPVKRDFWSENGNFSWEGAD